jgi:hypothetical protein
VRLCCPLVGDGVQTRVQQTRITLRHYQAAEKAQTGKNDAECNRELDAAAHALA